MVYKLAFKMLLTRMWGQFFQKKMKTSSKFEKFDDQMIIGWPLK